MEKAEQSLTLRQRQVLALLRQGKANKEIAWALGVRISTVKHHVTHACTALGVTNRIEAALAWERLCQAASTTPGAGADGPHRNWPAGSVSAVNLVPAEPALPLPMTPEDVFWNYVERSQEPDGCWIWTGCCPNVGAGPRPLCYIRGLAYLGHSARRIAYMLAKGVSLPHEVLVVLDCPRHNRRCVNPTHVKTQARGNAPEWKKWRLSC